MRFLVLIVFLCSTVISGCSELDKKVNKEFKTVEQATIESDIQLEDVFHTEEIDKYQAFSLYESPEGYGIVLFEKQDNGWEYRGSSSFDSAMNDAESITFSSSTWVNGEYSLDDRNVYTTVFWGGIIDPEISKVLVEYNNIEKDAITLKLKERSFWYLISKQDDGNERLSAVSGYASDGKLVYQNLINKE